MFSLEADREEAEEGVDDEGVHAEIRSVVISKKLPVLPPGYSVPEG